MDKGKIIKQLRLSHGMTQEELAKILHTTKQTIYKYEHNTITNIPSDKIKLMADTFGVSPVEIMGLSNVDIPAAYGVPILGTICAGDGVYAEQNFDGYFFVDHSIKADCCLYVHGDSMVDAGIQDGDIAFLKRDEDIEDGDICGVVLKDTNEAVLKKLYRADGHLILQPCNVKYKPLIEDPEDVQIVGEMVGVYHRTK